MARKGDRRVERTRQLLRDALLSLIREKGFEDLSVQEIIDRANVGRATFYAHFENKEDLLASGFEGLKSSLDELQRQAHSRGGRVDDRVFAFSREMFAHADEHREVFRAMVGKESGAVVERLLHKILLDLVRGDVKAVGSRGAGPVPTEALARFLAGALFGLLIWWVGGRTRLAVDEIDGLFRRLAIPALKASLRPA